MSDDPTTGDLHRGNAVLVDLPGDPWDHILDARVVRIVEETINGHTFTRYLIDVPGQRPTPRVFRREHLFRLPIVACEECGSQSRLQRQRDEDGEEAGPLLCGDCRQRHEEE